MLCVVQIEGEFPQIQPIRESLIKYVFEPAAEKVQPMVPSLCHPFCHGIYSPCAAGIMLLMIAEGC